MKSHTVLAATLLSGCCLSALSTPAFAQDAPAAGPAVGSPPAATSRQTAAVPEADIVVTARRRAESSLQVPVAVTAIGGEALATRAVTTLTRIAQLVPQVQLFQANGLGGASFAMRGLGSSFADAGLEQTVAVAVDGVQVGRGAIITAAQFDIKQVEVLKGPQALFFGKNSPAGVVSISSMDPGDNVEGYARAGYEFNTHTRYAEGAVSLPVSDNFAVRFAGRVEKFRGFVKNMSQPLPYIYDTSLTTTGATSKYSPQGQKFAGRVTALWKPTPDLSIKLKVTADRDEQNDLGGAVEQFCAPGRTGTTVFVGGQAYNDPTSDCSLDLRNSVGSLPLSVAAGMRHTNGGKPFRNQSSVLTSLGIEYQLGNIALTSTTGYYWIDFHTYVASDRSTFAALVSTGRENNETFTQEVRAASDFDSPLNFTVGAFLEFPRFTTGADYIAPYTGVNPVNGKTTTAERLTRNRNRSYSGFAQLRWQIVDQVELAGGARYTRDKKHVITQNTYTNPAVPNLVREGVIADGRYSADNVSPEVTLTWHPRPDMTIYGAYKTGYKAGGFSNPTLFTTGADVSRLAFGAEKAKGGEIGFKAALADRRLRLDFLAYSYRYSGLQVSSFDTPTSSFRIQNAAAARIKGLEGSVRLQATQEFNLFASVGYNDARFLEFTNAPCGTQITGACSTARFRDVSGSPLARAPDWSGNAGFTYDLALSDAMRLSWNGDIEFTSSYFTQEDLDPLARQDAFAKLNLAVRLHPDDDRWSLALIGTNLTNKIAIAASQGRTFGGPGQFNAAIYRPREVRLQAEVRF